MTVTADQAGHRLEVNASMPRGLLDDAAMRALRDAVYRHWPCTDAFDVCDQAPLRAAPRAVRFALSAGRVPPHIGCRLKR